MADTAEDARRYARTLREIKLHGVADAMDNYAALLDAMAEFEDGVFHAGSVYHIRQRAEEIRRG